VASLRPGCVCSQRHAVADGLERGKSLNSNGGRRWSPPTPSSRWWHSVFRTPPGRRRRTAAPVSRASSVEGPQGARGISAAVRHGPTAQKTHALCACWSGLPASRNRTATVLKTRFRRHSVKRMLRSSAGGPGDRGAAGVRSMRCGVGAQAASVGVGGIPASTRPAGRLPPVPQPRQPAGPSAGRTASSSPSARPAGASASAAGFFASQSRLAGRGPSRRTAAIALQPAAPGRWFSLSMGRHRGRGGDCQARPTAHRVLLSAQTRCGLSGVSREPCASRAHQRWRWRWRYRRAASPRLGPCAQRGAPRL